MLVAILMVLKAVKWQASKKAYLDYVGKLGILIYVFMTMIDSSDSGIFPQVLLKN